MNDQERIEKLAYELARARTILNHFIEPLTHRLYPQRDPLHYSPATAFKGSTEERIFEIFKMIDYEVRRMGKAAKALGIDLNKVALDHGAIFDDVSRATGITESSHETE